MSEYTLYYRCTNCGNHFGQRLSKGTLAPDIIPCPKCECRTALKCPVY